MRRRALGVTAPVVAALALAGPAAAGVSIAGVDTSGYPEVRVTVVTPPGSPQPRLLEDGRPVGDVTAVNLGQTKAVVLAVDRSQSMRGRPLADATAAARAFADAKNPDDRLEVIAFGRRAVELSGFSSSAADADAALSRLPVDTRSGTALWDAVVRAADDLTRGGVPGRVILLVTDGHDVSSGASYAQAVAAAHRARAAVYAVGVAGAGFAPDPLRGLAAATGGAYLQAASSSRLEALYASIGRRLAGTWQLRYPTAARPGDTIRLGVSVAGEGSASRSLELPRVGVGAAQPETAPLGSRSLWTSRYAPFALALAVGVLVGLAFAAVTAARSGSRLSARLAPHVGPSVRAVRQRRHRAGGRRLFGGALLATEHAFRDVRQFRSLQRLLTRADLPLLAAELLYGCVGAGVLVGLVTGIAGLPPLLVLLAMLLGGAAPVAWVASKARARMKAFDGQLPDLLITIAASLKAGHSFRHAIQAVVDEGAEPAAKEFRRVLTETRLGRPMDAALAEMGERIGSKNLSFVLTSVTIQRQIGGSLAGLFDMVAETVRQRQQFARKIRGLTAMGRMSAYVLAGLPFALAVLISLISPAYMAPLWHTSTGHELIGLGLAMLAVGASILKKIVSFRG